MDCNLVRFSAKIKAMPLKNIYDPMRIVGQNHRNELEFDPARALVRALAWRASDNAGTLAHPRGVFRGTQHYFEAMDAQRALAQARLLNQPSGTTAQSLP
jgi:hypothetical protein